MRDYDAELRESRVQTLIEESGIGSRYKKQSWDDFNIYNEELKNNVQKIKDFITALSEGQNRSLWLCGGCGTGKTFLACLIIKEVTRATARRCRYVKAYQLINMIEASGLNRQEILDKYSYCYLLVIDEVADTFNSITKEQSILWQILNERYESKLPVVIVSNLSKDELARFMGSKLVDRFMENCSSVNFTETGSYRGKRRNTNE